VRDALAGSLDNALNERGGLNEVRRRSSGHPTNFGIRLEFALKNGQAGHYAFNIGALAGRGYEVQSEECALGGVGKGPFFRIERGNLKASSETTFPAVTADRLALVAASGMAVFRPVFDALTAMGFYNLNPKLMRELQKPQEGRSAQARGGKHRERDRASGTGRRRQAGDHPGISSDGCADGSRRRAQADRADGNPGVPPGHGWGKTSVAISSAEHV
jgi:hypothetical protein